MINNEEGCVYLLYRINGKMRHFVYILSILFFCRRKKTLLFFSRKGNFDIGRSSVQVGNINTVFTGPWRMIYMWRFGKTVN